MRNKFYPGRYLKDDIEEQTDCETWNQTPLLTYLEMYYQTYRQAQKQTDEQVTKCVKEAANEKQV